jgi:sulfur carrier protein ThiS
MGTLKIALRLQGPFAKYGRGTGVFEWEMAADRCTVEELLAQIGIPATAKAFVSVDGIKRDPDYILQGGERIVVFPPVTGG